MRYYPAFLELNGRSSLVVGGGKVAARKASALLDRKARVSLVAPNIHPEILRVMNPEDVLETSYRSAYCDDKFLVVAATDDPELNRKVSSDARRCGALVNAVDQPDISDFICPAVVEREPLQIAISTGGNSPALAARMRRELEDKVPEERGDNTNLIGKIRDLVQDEVSDSTVRYKIFKLLAELA